MKKFFIVITLFLSACYGPTKNNIQTYSAPRFESQEPIKLKVNKVVVISEFMPSFQRPNIEHLFPISIEKAAKVWAEDRLEAVDFASLKEAVVTIKDASVTEELVQSEQFLQKDQLKYKATLHIIVKVRDENSFSSTQTEVIAWRELTIPYDTPITQKEKYWNGMIIKLMHDFNIQMTKNIHEYLAKDIEKTYIVGNY